MSMIHITPDSVAARGSRRAVVGNVRFFTAFGLLYAKKAGAGRIPDDGWFSTNTDNGLVPVRPLPGETCAECVVRALGGRDVYLGD